MAAADSAGVPWEGRQFHDNGWGGDDGSAPALLVEAIRRFRANEVGEAEVVDAVRESRLLVPLVAELGAGGRDERGGDKSQELSIVTVAGPDGRPVLPAFSSVAAMSAWNVKARPVPTPGVRVAAAAIGEGTDLVVIDPTSETEFALRRPALVAVATGLPWRPSYDDASVRDAFADAAAPELDVVDVVAVPGDPEARLAGPELVLVVGVRAGLDAASVEQLVSRMRERWPADLGDRVDSMSVRIEAR